MGQSYTNLLYHIVFSTKDRRSLIVDDAKPRLFDYIGGVIRNQGGVSLGINGTDDHVHILAKLRPDKALSDGLRDIKANASGWMHDVFPATSDFVWQRGYGAFTVSASQAERMISTSPNRNLTMPGGRFAMNSLVCCGRTRSNSTRSI